MKAGLKADSTVAPMVARSVGRKAAYSGEKRVVLKAGSSAVLKAAR